ncbi:PilN domain-containing protein [cf. Phormidesmis sp. LEGE 11477]|uniref:PilN domain-containing protein n=1 Tax=cf. Phormidesmis sp. LEGE 11477 TaxID=1828680 RepID=UPI0018808F59|nr:PilN domain-containing protein [cf. Phormidesmis sp. LEGE 11477]MBE9063072.1 PilN domain-containing protein [cf. Phormidesmis sp. LEGE 11477]
MYGIDINFLNDRVDRPVDAIVPAGQVATKSSARKVPMLIGLAVALCALGGVGSYWMVLEKQKDGLVAQSSALDSQLAELQQKIAQIDTVRQQTIAVNEEIQALASVFERIRPWSAIVRDMQGRIPARAQIETLVQTIPTEEGSVAGGIELGGNACSFNDVNDFLLTLQNSPFLVSDSIEIATANLGSEVPGRCPGEAETEESAELVSYTITGDIKSIPATALLDELNRQQESTGLAARIRALQATGAIE